MPKPALVIPQPRLLSPTACDRSILVAMRFSLLIQRLPSALELPDSEVPRR